MKGIVVSFFILVLLAGCDSEDNDLSKSLDFETIEKDFYSGMETSQNVIVSNINDWEDLWNQTVTWTPDERPFVNFNESMVIAVFMGEQNSGGFEIEILELKEADDVIEVVSKFTIPEGGSGVTTALTQPFHMIKINKTDKNIIFSQLH